MIKCYLKIKGKGRKLAGFMDKYKFMKRVSKEKHLFRALDAWGIDSKLFNEYIYPRNLTMYLFERDEMKIYKSTAENFRKNEQYFHFKNKSVDERTQVFLALKHWEIKTNAIKFAEKDNLLREYE